MRLFLDDDRPWKLYERQIFELLRRKAEPNATVEFDRHLDGKLSGVPRQVDVLVHGRFGGSVEVTLVVDCKCWSERVDVSDVDRFVGFIEDLRVPMGLLVTTKGFTEGAKRRADNARGISVEVVPFDELAAWEPPLVICQECVDARPADSFPGVIDFEGTEVEGADEIGRCDRCDTPHIRCSCGSITALAADGDWPCDGCGTVWILASPGYDRHGVESTSLDERIRHLR